MTPALWELTLFSVSLCALKLTFSIIQLKLRVCVEINESTVCVGLKKICMKMSFFFSVAVFPCTGRTPQLPSLPSNWTIIPSFCAALLG